MSLAARPFPGMWHSVWKLIRLRTLITYNNIMRGSRRVKIRYGFFALLIILVLVGGFALSFALLRLLQSPQAARFVTVDTFFQNVPVWILTIAFAILGVTSFGLMLQSLYLSGDMEFLLSTPVTMRALFIAKMIEAILPNFGLVCLFGLPILFGLGVAGGFQPAYYPLTFLVLIALALSIAAGSSLLVMIVVRVIPARRVAEMLGFLGAIVSVICSQSGQLVNTFNIRDGQMTSALNYFNRLNSPWSPLAWAGRGLAAIGDNNWFTGLGWLGAFLLLSGLIFVFALLTAERLYYTGWARVQGTTRRRRPSPRAAAQPVPAAQTLTAEASSYRGYWLNKLLPAPVYGIVAKDLHTLTRDLRNMSQLVTPLLFGVIYAFALTRSGFAHEVGPAPAAVTNAIRGVAVYGNIGISLFIGWSLLSRLALMSFSQERQNYWILKSAPVKAGQMMLAKYITAYLPPVLLGLVFIVGISLLQRSSFENLVFGAIMIIFALAGAAGINLAFGVAGTNLNWENPRQMIRGGLGCVASITSMVYLFLVIIVFFGPTLVVGIFGISPLVGQAIGLAIGIPFSLVCAFLPPRGVVGKIRMLGES